MTEEDKGNDCMIKAEYINTLTGGLIVTVLSGDMDSSFVPMLIK